MQNNLIISDYTGFLNSLKKRVAAAQHQAMRNVNRELISFIITLALKFLKIKLSRDGGRKSLIT